MFDGREVWNIYKPQFINQGFNFGWLGFLIVAKGGFHDFDKNLNVLHAVLFRKPDGFKFILKQDFQLIQTTWLDFGLN